jgi:hypothetical protein
MISNFNTAPQFSTTFKNYNNKKEETATRTLCRYNNFIVFGILAAS